ncbi:P-loop NTPase fold protein [Porphyromonas loveana]|uniref:P-loop NTPase fold protein n=1 Tax=Porphyromonas loveana TaxID=1884669 RepID=UPI0035A07AF5
MNVESSTTIILSKSNNAADVKQDGLIHWRKINEVLGWIDADLPAKAENKEPIRFNHAISIIGDRGSGKTTFLRTLKGVMETEKKNLYTLDIIDPTLIEEKGHPFLIVLSLIKQAFYSNLKDSKAHHSYARQEWECRLEKLAAGLPSIENISNTFQEDPSWQDPNFIMRKGLNAVNSASSIQSNFRELIQFTLKELDKDAFVIFLDDIDIDFKKGWPVLEMLRKYLDIPEIITVISGDLHLFSKAIRKQQWMNFGKALLKNEVDNYKDRGKKSEQEYERLVTNMEQQYMRKVLRPNRMIVLPYLSEWYDWNAKKLKQILIAETEEKKGEAKPILEQYEEIFKHYGIKNPEQLKIYTKHYLSLPTRTQLQFIHGYLCKDKSKGLYILESFLNEFMSSEVDVFSIRSQASFFIPAILTFLIKEDILSISYQLRPVTGSKQIDTILSSFSLSFSRRIAKKPELIFDYWIRICYIRNVIEMSDVFIENTQKVHDRLVSNIPMHYIVGGMMTSLRSLLSGRGLASFTISAKTGKNLENTLSSIPIGRINFYHPHFSREYHCSFMFILAAIHDCIANRHSYDREDNNQVDNSSIREENIASIKKRLLENLEIRDYREQDYAYESDYNNYDYVIEENDDEDEVFEEDDQNNKTSDNDDIKILSELMEDWCVNSIPVVPPYLLGKAFTKFCYAERRIRLFFAKHGNNACIGDELHRIVIAFYNAILYEECRDFNIDGLSPFNPIKSSKEFIYNLEKANEFISKQKEDNDETSSELQMFSQWILSCPLLICFINLSDLEQDINNTFIKFTNITKKTLIPLKEINQYEILKKIEQKNTYRIERKRPMHRDYPQS